MYYYIISLYIYPLYPSAPTIPIDHGIKTISKYKYLHSKRTKPYATTTKFCSWLIRYNHIIYPQSCPFICCPQICDRYAAELISASAESRRMFLMEVTKKCLEAAKKDRDSNQMTSSWLKQPTTNTTSSSITRKVIQYFYIQ